MTRSAGFAPTPDPRRGVALVAVLAAMAVVLLLLAGLLKLAVAGRRQLVRELDVRQAESLLDAAADRAVAKLRAEPAWSGGTERVASEAIVGAGDAEVVTEVIASPDTRTLRIVVDYPERAEAVLNEHNFAHDDVPVVAIELQSESQLKDVTSILLKAEINIHYVYPFLFRPNGRYGLVVRTEAQELAASVLATHGITVIGRGDIAR